VRFLKTSNFRKKLFHLSKILRFANQKLFFQFQKLPITSEKQQKTLENNLSFSAQTEKLDLFRLRNFFIISSVVYPTISFQPKNLLKIHNIIIILFLKGV